MLAVSDELLSFVGEVLMCWLMTMGELVSAGKLGGVLKVF